MYDNPRQRGGRRVAGARARRGDADLHEGDRHDFLRRHGREAATAALGGAQSKRELLNSLLPRTADARNLRCAWDWLTSGDGDAPGSDGLRYDDLDEDEAWEAIRAIG